MDDRIILRKGSTSIELARPDVEAPYYRGTRFDRTGNILNLKYKGHSFISQWFRSYDPFRHDAVGGTAEEFTQIGYEDVPAGGEFLKIGVGVLRSNSEPYDRFKLYEVADPGEYRVELLQSADAVRFVHSVKGRYSYVKVVCIPEEGVMTLDHALRNDGSELMESLVYCHNFFVLDGERTGKATRFTLPFCPQGHWRSDYDSVHLVPDGIEFLRDLADGESVFMGDLNAGRPVENYSFKLENLKNGLSVRCQSDAAMEYAVFWSNQDVSCIEPYVRIRLAPGQSFRWTIRYAFDI